MTTNSPALPDNTLPEELPIEALSEQQDETNAQIAGATGILALGNVASRILGLAREMVLTFLFGAGIAADAFQVAIIVPKAIYDLLIGGHINGAIVPVLSEVVTVKGKDELWQVVSILLSLVTALLAVLVLVIELLAQPIVHVVSSGANEQTLSLAADLLRLTTPALIFMGLFAVFSGTLYALRIFTWPAFQGVVFNGCIVGITLLLAPAQAILPVMNNASLFPFEVARPPHTISVMALGWLIGAVAQMLLQLPGLRGAKLRISINWRHPALAGIAILYAPVMFSLIMDTLIIRPFSYNLASQTGSGSIGYMNWATTLIQFPQGLVATAISVAILPTLARQAALLNLQGVKAFKDTLGLGLRLATTLIIPAAVGLFVMATPIVALLFENGAFTPADTAVTAHALRLYLIGLPFAAIDLLLVYAFYARKDTLTPALIGVLSLLVYMITASALLNSLGLYSLMVADSAKHIVHATLSAYILIRRMQGFGKQHLLITFAKTAFAAALMGIIGIITLPTITDLIGNQSVLREIVLVVISGSLYGGIFIVLAMLLRIEELRWIMRLVKKRILR